MSATLLRLSIDALDAAMPVDVVEEIIARPPHRPLPHAPPHLVGLASHRGAPLPLVDLGVLVGERSVAGAREGRSPEAHEDTPARVVVVALDESQRAGFFVSRVAGVVLRHEAMVPSAPMSDALASVVRGELHLDGVVVMELDPRALFEVARAR